MLKEKDLLKFKLKEGFALVLIFLLLLSSFFSLQGGLEGGVTECTHAHWLENTFHLFTSFSLRAKP